MTLRFGMFDLSIGKIIDKIKIKKPGYLNDSILFWCFIASILLLALALGAIELLLPKDLDFISLHYNIYTGIDRAGLRSEMRLYVLAARSEEHTSELQSQS